jgi:hypothetical protein
MLSGPHFLMFEHWETKIARFEKHIHFGKCSALYSAVSICAHRRRSQRLLCTYKTVFWQNLKKFDRLISEIFNFENGKKLRKNESCGFWRPTVADYDRAHPNRAKWWKICIQRSFGKSYKIFHRLDSK